MGGIETVSTASWVTCYGLLSAYCLAGSLMEHFAVISGWNAVDAASFPAVHKAQVNGVAAVLRDTENHADHLRPRFRRAATCAGLDVTAARQFGRSRRLLGG